MRTLITKLWVATILLLGIGLSNAPNVQAQTIVGKPGETEVMGKWAQSFNARQIELVDIFGSPEFTALLESFSADIDTETLERTHTAWLKDTNFRTNALRKKIDLMSPPVLESNAFKKMNPIFTTQRESLNVSLGDVETLIDDMDKLVVQIINGDDSNMSELEKIVFISARKMLQGENRMMETSINLVQVENHPSIPLLKIMIEVNIMGMYLIDIDILSVDDLVTLEDRKPYIKKIESSLKRAHKEKSRAYRDAQKLQKQIERLLALTNKTAEKYTLTQASKIYESFKLSIDNEAEILEVSRKQIELLKADDEYWSVSGKMVALDDQFVELINRRLALQNDRTVILQKLQ